MHLPELKEASRIALFLDFDGTLVPIAPRPQDVTLDAATRSVIGTLHSVLQGAVAVVTGRDIATIDQFLSPLHIAVAGVHGTVRRDASGRIVAPSIAPEHMAAVRQHLAPLLARQPALLLEEKHASLALHYRAAPECEAACLAAMEGALAEIGLGEIKRGHCVVEAKFLPGDKGSAIADFLMEPPFAGRRPVFAGDDVTDEDAFAVVNAAGGISIKIGQGTTSASYRAADTHHFTAWLRELANDLQGGHHVG